MYKQIFSLFAVSVFILTFSQTNLAQNKRKSKIVGVVTVRASPPDKLTPEQKRRIETFEQVWSTINENYFDKTFNGVDWMKIRAEFLPKVKAAKNDSALHLLLQEMINRLNRSHFFIIPPEAYKEIEEAKSESKRKEREKQAEEKADGKIEDEVPEDKSVEDEEVFDRFGLPIDVRVLETQVVITNVQKDSNADKAGLKVGFVIDKINGISLKEFMIRLQNYNAYSKTMKHQMPAVLLSFMEGEENSEVELTVLDEKDVPKTLLIKRQGLKGELVNIIKNIPAQLLKFESKSLNDKIGYIKFNFFAFPVLDKFCAAVTEFKSKEAIIIDMRGNSGGAFGVLFGLGGLLTDKAFPVGTQISRRGKSVLSITPMPNNYKGKLVVLVDEQSVSAAEIFSAGMQENGRALVVGDRSAGEALPSLTQTLPTGAVFLYPIANFQSPKGNFLEGKGVEPNVQIQLNRQELLAGKDAQLETAISYIKENNQLIPKLTPTPKPLFTVLIPRGDNINNDDEPPPVKAPTPKELINLPPTPKPTPNSPISIEKNQDEKALQVVKDYISAIGGEAALRKITSLTAFGTAELKTEGTVVEGEYDIYRKSPDKLTEVLTLESVGQIREVFNGKQYFVQSYYSGVIDQTFSPLLLERKLFSDFNEFLTFAELYPKIKYTGTFERLGRKINLIEATSKEGIRTAFAFDIETKFLVSRSGTYFDATFEDYAKTGEIMYPMTQSRSLQLKIKLIEVNFNTKIDDKKFVKEDNCFTKID
jgi:carboxyl-terminal processing protease